MSALTNLGRYEVRCLASQKLHHLAISCDPVHCLAGSIDHGRCLKVREHTMVPIMCSGRGCPGTEPLVEGVMVPYETETVHK